MNQIKTFDKHRVFKTMFAGRELTVETGKTCELANGSCWVKYGETVVLVTATASTEQREGVDFFPLTVDYEEKMYAVGKIPGGFIRREGKATENATLSVRCIDRPIRPMFPKTFKNHLPRSKDRGIINCKLFTFNI